MSRPYQIVQPVGLKESLRSYLEPGRYALTPKAGWVPLQRLCLWVLDRIGAQAYATSVEYSTYTIDAQTFQENLYEQRRSLFQTFNSEVDYVLVGREDYMEIMHSAAPLVGVLLTPPSRARRADRLRLPREGGPLDEGCARGAEGAAVKPRLDWERQEHITPLVNEVTGKRYPITEGRHTLSTAAYVERFCALNHLKT